MAAADVSRLSLRAGFVFVGIVERTGATTVDLVEPTKETAVVRIGEVVRAPEDFGDRKGSAVTVRLRSSARKGNRAVFFTIGWISGTGLAVQEIGRVPAKDLVAVKKQMDDAVRKQQTAELRKRVASAAVIVVGRVASIYPFGDVERAPSSEHDPQWRTALLDVEGVVKGNARKGERLEIAFASSRDVMWYAAPKPVVEEQAIFLGQRHKLEELDATALAIVEPLDMQPVGEIDRIQALLKRR
jgi:hypothetical protein